MNWIETLGRRGLSIKSQKTSEAGIRDSRINHRSTGIRPRFHRTPPGAGVLQEEAVTGGAEAGASLTRRAEVEARAPKCRTGCGSGA